MVWNDKGESTLGLLFYFYYMQILGLLGVLGMENILARQPFFAVCADPKYSKKIMPGTQQSGGSTCGP